MFGNDPGTPGNDRTHRPARSLPAALRDGERLRRWFAAVEAGTSAVEAGYQVGANVVGAVCEVRRVLADPEALAQWTAPEVEAARAVIARYQAAVRPAGFTSRPASAATCAAVLAAIGAPAA